MDKHRFIHVTKEVIDAYEGFEIVSYGEMEIIVRNRLNRDEVIVFWMVDGDAYDELLAFFLDILPKARPDPAW